MPQFDLPLSELRKYQPNIDEPSDFDSFWQLTVDEVRQADLNVTYRLYEDTRLPMIDVFDVSFSGYGNQVVRGWLLLPKTDAQTVPCVISFVGYGGGRSLPIAHTWAPAAGIAHFVMDSRGQGAKWSPGETDDEFPGGPPHAAGFMTRGIQDPSTYYYRRLMADTARAIEAALAHPRIDSNRLALAGGSQGGALAIAASVLSETPVRLLMVDVPFLCHFKRATQITDQVPYAEIVQYLSCHRGQETNVFKTLSYFDGCNFAKRVKVDSYFSVGLMDQVCPPSTVFAAYNQINGVTKDIDVYPYNGHEGGGVYQLARWVKLLQQYLAID